MDVTKRTASESVARYKLCSPVESWFSTGQRRNHHEHPHETQNHPAKKNVKGILLSRNQSLLELLFENRILCKDE